MNRETDYIKDDPERMKMLYAKTPGGLENLYNIFVEQLDRAYCTYKIVDVQYGTHGDGEPILFTCMVRYRGYSRRNLPT